MKLPRDALSVEERLHLLEVSDSINNRGTWWSVDRAEDAVKVGLYPQPHFGIVAEMPPDAARELAQQLLEVADAIDPPTSRAEGWEQHSRDTWPPPVGAKVYPVMADGTVEKVEGEVSQHWGQGGGSPLVFVQWSDQADAVAHGSGHLVLVSDYQAAQP